MNKLIILLCILLFGCSKTEYITKEVKIPIYIKDTVRAVELDTVIQGYKVVEKETTAVIKYYPKLKYFDYVIKDTIKIVDTIQVIKEKEKKIGFFDSIKYHIIIAFMLCLVIYFFRK